MSLCKGSIYGHLLLLAAGAMIGSAPPAAQAAQAAQAGRQECRGAAKDAALAAFRKGLAALEAQEWPRAIRRAEDRRRLQLHRRFDLGAVLWPLALPFRAADLSGRGHAHLADCLTDCNQHCPAVDPLKLPPREEFHRYCTQVWGQQQEQLLPPSSVKLSGCWRGRCARVWTSEDSENELDCPAVDLFVELRKHDLASTIAATPDPIGECQELTTPSEWLWQALSGQRGTDQGICEGLLEELPSVANWCPEPAP